MPIPMELHQQLLLASLQSGFEKEVWEIGAAAIRDWLTRNQPDTFTMAVTNGYQWKTVFLPHGTLLRTVFHGKNFHARVEGDRMLFDGAATSPSRFVNAVGGVRRNAWKVLWILLPSASEWKRADSFRPRNNPSGLKNLSGRSWKASRQSGARR